MLYDFDDATPKSGALPDRRAAKMETTRLPRESSLSGKSAFKSVNGSHGNLWDAEALDLLKQKLRVGDELKFKLSYIANLKQVMPGRKFVRFFQTENRFNTASVSELCRIIPFMR